MNTKQKNFIIKKLIPFVQREHGNGFVMDNWIAPLTEEHSDFDGVEHRVPACGTVACLGGSIQLLKSLKKSKFKSPIDLSQFNTNSNLVELSKFIGLTFEQANGLFYHWEVYFEREFMTEEYGWPVKFRRAFDKAKTPRGKASVAVRLLKEVVRTNGKCLNPTTGELAEELESRA